MIVIGTPVDEHLNPDPGAVTRALLACDDHFRDGQLIILRSTVFPGVTAAVERHLTERGLDVDVTFCPERIAEGHAMTELFELPQIIGSRTERAAERASALFRTMTDSVVHVSPEEAELAKLFTNAWRYVKFATANQFFMMANDFGLDFERIRAAVTFEYPRAADMPSPGFAAGPCLLKDTMQLAAFTNNTFVLGHSAMLVNEGLPLYVVSRLEQRFELRDADRRPARDGLQGRIRRRAREPRVQAAADPARSGRVTFSAPTRTSPPTRRCCRSTRSWPVRTCS